MMIRDIRQKRVLRWVIETFGWKCALPSARAVRFFEEAVELAQACGVPEEMAMKVVSHVYSKPVGSIEQEIGGVGITLLALAQSLFISADFEEFKELRRVERVSPEHLQARHQAKIDAGIAT